MKKPYSTVKATYLLLAQRKIDLPIIMAAIDWRIYYGPTTNPLNFEPIETSDIYKAMQLTCSVLNNRSAMNVRAWDEKIPSYFPVLVFEKLEADRWTAGSGAGLSTDFQPPGFPETEIGSEWVEAGQTHWAGQVENTTRPTGVQSDQL